MHEEMGRNNCIHTTNDFHPYKAIVTGVNHYFFIAEKPHELHKVVYQPLYSCPPLVLSHPPWPPATQ